MGSGKIRVDPMKVEAGDLLVTDGRMSLELGDVLLVVCKLSDVDISQSNKKHLFVDGRRVGDHWRLLSRLGVVEIWLDPYASWVVKVVKGQKKTAT
tara:strand:+ start:356 stop:643 length:288 start_codon:yes stop_codon:yes gene_type:complete